MADEHDFPERLANSPLNDDPVLFEKARARGEAHGFTGIFLVAFIERELRLKERWAKGRQTQVNKRDIRKGDYSPWGGRFDRGLATSSKPPDRVDHIDGGQVIKRKSGRAA